MGIQNNPTHEASRVKIFGSATGLVVDTLYYFGILVSGYLDPSGSVRKPRSHRSGSRTTLLGTCGGIIHVVPFQHSAIKR